MTGGDLLLELGLEGLRKHPSYQGAMTGKLRDYDINNIRCRKCKHDYRNLNDTLCMFCPVFVVATSEFLYAKIGSM